MILSDGIRTMPEQDNLVLHLTKKQQQKNHVLFDK